ncbi:MAG: DUF1269 domain-containing protein [Chloroflexi bacterium]|nr:DUF1269 domain-containing protein [Chloroflexota bacterium]
MSSMIDVGIDDDAIKQIRAQVTPGTSALFVLSQNALQDRMAQRLHTINGHVTLVQLYRANGQEAGLRETFGEEPSPAAAASGTHAPEVR